MILVIEFFFSFFLMITILQWNARSVRANGAEFKKAIFDLTEKPDIICIQETWLSSTDHFSLPGYVFIRKDRVVENPSRKSSSHRGGCGIFIKRGIAAAVVPSDIETLEYQIIEVFSLDKNDKIFIVNCYNPSTQLSSEVFGRIFDKISSEVIICGDFNGHNPLWGSNKLDSNGKILEDVLDMHNLVCLNDGTGTRLDSHTGLYSCIDITLVSSSIAAKCSWAVFDDFWGSDHLPIFTTYGMHHFKDPHKFTPKWSFKKVNWSEFDSACEHYIANPDINASIDTIYTNFVDQIGMAANASIPKTKPIKSGINPVPWWNTECDEAIRNKRKARNRLKRSRLPSDLIAYKRASAIARRVIRHAKKEDWRQFCGTIVSSSDTALVWKKIKKISHTKTYHPLPVLKNDKHTAVTDLDKAEMLVDSFARVSSNDNYSPNFLKVKDKEEVNFKFSHTSDDGILDDPFTFDELDNAIIAAKCTSPGGDGIHMNLIKHLPVKTKKFLLVIFNIIWSSSQCPAQWKEAVLAPILKPGKDPTDPISYRPIALTSTLCKTMERMVNKRLQWFLESRGLLDPTQSGFRQGRRTTDHLVGLESSVNKAFSNKESTLAVFLDIHKAYDMVWRKGVIIKLQKMGVGGRMSRWIDNFLSNRSIRVRVNGIFSAIKIVMNGVPQGSVISPILFNIIVNDIPKMFQNIKVSQYADDIAIWKSGRNLKFLAKQIQKGLDDLSKWCHNWGFKISAPKTVGMVFTRKTSTPALSLSLEGNRIKLDHVTRFLGLIFDSRLSWAKHIEHIINKCKPRLNLLRCISGTDWGADGKLLYNLYRALIRSVLDYGCEAFNSAPKSIINKLNHIQYQALKICSGAICHTSLIKLQVECGEPPLHLRRQFLTQAYALTVSSRASHPNNPLFLDCWQRHYFDKKWSADLIHTPFEARCSPPDFPVFESSPCRIPFWMFEKPHVSLAITNLINKSMDLLIQRDIAINYINRTWHHGLHVFTDGSVDLAKGHVGCGFFIPSFKYARGFRLPKGISIFSAELMAVYMALEWVEDVKPSVACIFCDSISALQAIVEFAPSNKIVCEILYLLCSLKVQGIQIDFEWVPSHCGVFGNEIVDLVAKNAAVRQKADIILPLSVAEGKYIYKCHLKKSWQDDWDCNAQPGLFQVLHPCVGFRMPSWNCSRKEEVIFRRLRMERFGGTNHFRFLIGLHPNGLCDICGCLDSVEHLLFTCKKYNTQREELFSSLSLGSEQKPLCILLLGGKDPPIKSICTYIYNCNV